MKDFELKYGCNPNQKPSKIFMNKLIAIETFAVQCKEHATCRQIACICTHAERIFIFYQKIPIHCVISFRGAKVQKNTHIRK